MANAKTVRADQGAPAVGKKSAKSSDPSIVEVYSDLDAAGKVKFWLAQLEQRAKEEKKFTDDAKTTNKVYWEGSADDADSNISKFNILAANVDVLAPTTYSATPRPDVRRRFADADPSGKVAAEVLERGLEYTNDQFDVDHEINASVLDMLLPGRGVSRVMYECETSEVSPGVKLEARGNDQFVHPNGRILGKMPDGNGYGFLPDGAGDTAQWEPVEGEPESYTPKSASKGPAKGKSASGSAEAALGDEDDDDVTEWYLGGTPYPHVENERTWFEHVDWQDFRHGDGRTWREVEWVAFRHAMTREQLRGLPITRKLADEIKLDYDIRGTDDKAKRSGTGSTGVRPDQDSMPFMRALVWEIFYKGSKQVIFIAPSYKKAPLVEEEPQIRFDDFFPCPRPLLARANPDNLTPSPEYFVYKGLAEELNRAVRRLQRIVSAMKARGIYAGAIVDFERVFKADENELIPSTSAQPLIAGGAAMSDLVWMVPVDKYIQVLQQLYAYVINVKQTIYEITGISDIARGASNPNETLGAQQLKVQFASIRIQQRQKEVQRFVRDLIRMEADAMCQLYGAETWADITRLKLPSPEEKGIGKQAAQAVAQGVPPPNTIASIEVPDGVSLTEYLKRPTWDDVVGILRDTIKRTHKIDIETDSTIAADQASQQKGIVDLIGAIVQFFEGVSPFVATPGNPQGILPPDAAKTILMSAVRRFRMGTEVEEALDMIGSPGSGQGGAPAGPQAGQPPAPEPPNPLDVQKLQQQGQKDQAELALDARKVAVDEGHLALDVAKFKAEEAEKQRVAQPLDQIHSGIMQQVGGLAQGTNDALTQISQTVQATAQAVASISGEVQQILQELDAPAEVLRDGGGNLIGVKKGNRVRTVVRDGKGRPRGLQ